MTTTQPGRLPGRAGPQGPAAGPAPSAPDAPASQRLALRRPGRRLAAAPPHVPRPEPASSRRPALIAGVCAGVGAHLGLPVRQVRLAAVVLALAGGAGLLLYLLLWVAVPVGDPWAEAWGTRSPARRRLASRPPASTTASRRLGTALGGGALLAAAALAALWRSGGLRDVGVLLPLVLIVSGAALAWSQVDALTGPARRPGAALRLAGGVVLAAVGIVLWVASETPPRALLAGGLTGGALVVGVGLVLAPLWLRTHRALAETRAAEAREAERADIAAHLHDSVLQTLTLIRRRSGEPEVVARLARSQERELRAWLYTDRPEPGTSVADAFQDLAGEIEDRYGVAVDTVCVGDRAPDRSTEVVVAAAREALSNAVRHGAPPVSLYVEAGAWGTEVFIRDRGEGFDPEDLARIAPDRHGVRESIIARMERHGGQAHLRRLERGTEVRLVLPAPD
ncbi:PspC domain-containing protein [Actinomyces bowdenii]|uniref:PspC domain-containing protein n=2 Tax=Actinomyces bowdenii TaxID=131109 RepID=UPI00214C2BCA|nr:PspC domain-containing protein [Actinomyces bowdenii]MCR2053072.1 PspC domain-containing protein [Actinomyces bowdenii]